MASQVSGSEPTNVPSESRNSRKHFSSALALALLSGAAGLAHQIVWTRRLVDILGANADTFSKVIGTFFAGLAVGAWCSGRHTKTTSSWWKEVAKAEVAVAAFSVPLLLSASCANWIYGHLTLGPALKLLLPLLLVGPPAVAMGLVTPWMIRALATNPHFAPRQAVWLYALNTFGGVLGIGLMVLQVLPRLGLNGAGLTALSLNLLAAGGAMGLHRRANKSCVEKQPDALAADVDSPLPSSAWKNLDQTRILAFASGFLVLALEVIFQHQFAQVLINSLFSSAVVLIIVLTSLALAAALVPLLLRWRGTEERALSVVLFSAALFAATQPLVLTTLRGGLTILPYELPPVAYGWQALQLGLMVLCPVLVTSGCIFPLLLRKAVAATGARSVGPLLAWNGVGGWLGAELGQAWIAPTFGLWGSMVAVAAGYGLLFGGLSFRKGPQGVPRRSPRFVAPIILMTMLAASGWLVRRQPQASVAPSERLVAIAVGREGVVATVASGPGDWRMLFNNSYTLGGSKAQFNQERQALLPLLLHGHPQRVATLGVATGGTVAGASLHPAVESIEAIELSPLVLRYARDFFGPYNRHIFTDPRIHFFQEDARWIMAGRRAAYDVVVGDLFLPWRTGEARLFTREHFQNVRRALRPGGLFCQWLPMFQLTRPQFATIARTFQEVFPDAYLVRGDFYADLPILGLIGGLEVTRLNWGHLADQCEHLRNAGKSRDPLVRQVEGVAMMLLGPLPPPGEGPRNTLGNSWVEWDAGKNILGMPQPWFVGVPGAEYVRDVQRAGQKLLAPPFQPAQEAGQFFLTLEIASLLRVPQLAELKAQAYERLPPSLRTDAAADWQQWPSRVKFERAQGP